MFNLVPKLRFKEFQSTSDWKVVRLEKTGSFVGGGTPSTKIKEYWDGDIPWVSSSDLTEESIYKIHKHRFITNNAIDKSATKKIPKNSILIISRVGVGKLAINKDIICTSQDFQSLVVKNNNCIFLAYLIKEKIKLLASYNQGTSIKGFVTSDLKSLQVQLPLKLEQQKIADCLSSLDNLITAHIQKHEALKKHKKGLMQKLFPKEGEKIPKFRFKEFSDDWENKILSDICKKISQGGTPSTSKQEYWNGDIEWLTPAEMGKLNTRYIKSTNRKITKKGLEKCSSSLLPINSVILSTRAPIGHILINKKEMAINQGCKAFIPNINYNFLYYYLLNNIRNLNDLGAGNTFKELSAMALKNFPINLPKSEQEQQKIADCLSAVDELISTQTEKIATLKANKKGLMQKLFPQEGEKIPKFRFKEFSDNWEKVTLSNIANTTTGNSNREDSTSSGGSYTFFDRSEDIRTSSKYLFDGEAIIVAGEGQKFIPKYFNGKFDLHQRTYAIMNFNKNTFGKFVYYYIFKNRNYFLQYAVGSTVKSLRLPMFKEMPVLIPKELKEQQKIADCLSAIDELISTQAEKITTLKAYKKGLMQQLFVSN
jgi:type I restriction enzyme S subunit